MTPTLIWRACVAAAALVVAATAAAQQAAAPPGARVVTGIVTDTAGVPVDSADVSISSLKQRTIAGSDGTFRFTGVKPGRYSVSARRIGFAPQVRTVVVGPDGGTVRFSLVPTLRVLAPVVTSAAPGGLSGVVGDTAYAIVPGAQVTVLGTDHRAVSDSVGRFFINLHEGRYVVRVMREGYNSRMMSVTIPPDSGRRVTVWLEPGHDGARHREVANFEALNNRLIRRTPSSKVYTREDLSKTSMTEVTQLVTAGTGAPIDDNCMAIIDGGPRQLPIWDITANDIELLELYPPGSITSDATSLRVPTPGALQINGQRLPALPKNGYGCDVTVYVWLRK
ncbi:MAG: carboxypeptidase-like regulatory domain-containing protein [Gemmatimonadaceae bacterium]